VRVELAKLLIFKFNKMELNNLLQSMHEELMSTNNDLDKFNSGNKSAGTRIRKAMQNIKHLAQSVRVKVQEVKNAELV
jgi:hypothetical protein